MQKSTIILPMLFLLLSFLLLISCEPKRIPEKDMVHILSSVFLTDALVNHSDFSRTYLKKDSIEYYKPIYSKMGYTDKQFLNSIDYLVKNHQQLDQALDRVINELSVLETEIKTQKITDENQKFKKNTDNLWPLKRHWIFPRDGKQEKLQFKIPTKGIGYYSISASVRVKDTDDSINPEMVVWFTSDNETSKDAFSISTREAYKKDNVSRRITINQTLTDSTITHIMGFLLNHQPKDGDWGKNAEVLNITVLYNPFPEKEIKSHVFPITDSILPFNYSFKFILNDSTFTNQSIFSPSR